MLRRHFMALASAASLAIAPGIAGAQDAPAPFDNPEDVTIALVRYLSTGDFFQAYLSGVESQAAALGVNLRVFDSRQDAALHADMVDQAIPLRGDGIVIQHGLTESMREATQRAVDAGTTVVAVGVTVEHPPTPQPEQSYYLHGKLALVPAVPAYGHRLPAAIV